MKHEEGAPPASQKGKPKRGPRKDRGTRRVSLPVAIEPTLHTYRVYWLGRPEVGVLLITAPDLWTAKEIGCEVLRCKRHADIVAEPVG